MWVPVIHHHLLWPVGERSPQPEDGSWAKVEELLTDACTMSEGG